MIPFQLDYGQARVDQENLGRLFDRQVLARLAQYLRPHWRRLAMAIVAMFAYTGVAVAVPWLVRLAIDSYIQAIRQRLSAAQAEDILGGTAARLLGI